MEEEVKYTSEFDGQTTDEVLKHAKSVKDLTIPSLSNISGFVCIDNEGKAIGMMSKEQVAQVVGGLIGLANGEKNGLMSYYAAKVTGLGMIKSISNKQFIKITKLEAKAWVIGYCEIICFRTANFATQKTTKILVPMSTDSQTQQAAKPTFLCGESGEVELYKDTSNNLYVKHNYIYNMAIIVTMHSQYNSLDLEVVNDTPTGLEKIAFA